MRITGAIFIGISIFLVIVAVFLLQGANGQSCNNDGSCTGFYSAIGIGVLISGIVMGIIGFILRSLAKKKPAQIEEPSVDNQADTQNTNLQ